MARRRQKFTQGQSNLHGLRISRRPGENIMIHVPASREDITIWLGIDKVQGVTTRLAFQAPKQVEILREELISNDQVSEIHADT